MALYWKLSHRIWINASQTGTVCFIPVLKLSLRSQEHGLAFISFIYIYARIPIRTALAFYYSLCVVLAFFNTISYLCYYFANALERIDI